MQLQKPAPGGPVEMKEDATEEVEEDEEEEEVETFYVKYKGL